MSRFARTLIVLVALLCAASGAFVASSDEGLYASSEEAAARPQVIVYEPSVFDAQSISQLHYQSLGDGERAAYEALYQGISEHLRSFSIQIPNSGDIEVALHAIMADHPEFFWLTGACTYQDSVVGDTRIDLDYNVAEEDVDAIQAAIDASAATYLAGLPPDASAYEKVKAAYEWVINTTDYGYESAQNQNIQSVFLDHVSVCAGYAKAFQYLLGLVDVPCAYVRGAITGQEIEHAWCIADIEGTPTYVDVTWGDPTYTGAGGEVVTGNITYNYLCLTTDEMQRCGHDVTSGERVPVCESSAYDYYRMNGLLFDTYDKARVDAVFGAAFDVGLSGIGLKFDNDEAYAQALSALQDGSMLDGTFVERAAEWQGATSEVSYQTTMDDALRVIEIYW